MSTVLLDTNVVSFVFKGDTRASDYAPLLQGHRLAVSFMTVAELYEWAATRGWGDKRVARLEQALSSYLVIPSDAALCRSWGRLRSQQRAIGKTIAPQDAWIAATALRYALLLITHDPDDFRDVAGLEVRSIL